MHRSKVVVEPIEEGGSVVKVGSEIFGGGGGHTAYKTGEEGEREGACGGGDGDGAEPVGEGVRGSDSRCCGGRGWVLGDEKGVGEALVDVRVEIGGQGGGEVGTVLFGGVRDARVAEHDVYVAGQLRGGGGDGGRTSGPMRWDCWK